MNFKLFSAVAVPSSPPQNIKAVALSGTSISVSWDKKTNPNITGYIVFYKEKSKLSDPYSSMATTGQSVNLIGLKVYTKYALRVLAYTNLGNGIPSEMFYITTNESGMQISVHSGDSLFLRERFVKYLILICLLSNFCGHTYRQGLVELSICE